MFTFMSYISFQSRLKSEKSCNLEKSLRFRKEVVLKQNISKGGIINIIMALHFPIFSPPYFPLELRIEIGYI